MKIINYTHFEMNTLILNLVLLVLVFYARFSKAIGVFDDEITVEDENLFPEDCRGQKCKNVHVNQRTKSWDFVDEMTITVNEEDYAVPMDCNGDYGETARDKRRVRRSPKSRVVEAMLNTPMLHLNPAEPDVFSILRDQYELPKPFKGPLTEYDFIVVGAGSAGSVLASRLSESHQASVLLLEAGVGESMFTDVPIMAPLLQQTQYVWPYLMEPQPGVCKGMDGERCFWPRGRAVGGSSVVNYMIYTRGLKVDWDRIAADGNYGWSYDEVLPYFIKSEGARLKAQKNSPYHGKVGELSVEDIPFRSKLSKAFLDSAKLLGNRIVDYNSPDGFGFNFIQATTSRGHRHSSAKAFLHGHKKRKNLHILPSALATRVLIDPDTNNAYGVEFQRNGKLYRVRATKEVILSAGPIESPHLLMLSGIGPRSQLQSFGIPVVKDLKVGEVLYDHISFPALAFTINQTRLTLVERKVATVDNVIKYMHYGEGPMSSLAGVETIGYIKTNISDEIGDVPDIELLGSCASLASDDGNIVAKGIHLSDWLYNDVYRSIENVESFTILFMLLHPKSKGHLELRSARPLDYPKMYGNYLTHPQDVATMIAAIRYIIKMVETEPFQKYGAKLHRRKYPNCRQYNFDSDEYWECAVRTVTSTLHHQIATCKMGPSSDPYAIVDPELKVHGLNGLRVVDSSIIPRTTAAHTNAPAIMIGEKAADMIKAAWNIE